MSSQVYIQKWICYLEQPAQEFPFRYISEGKKHGVLLGRNVTENFVSCPKLQISKRFQCGGKIKVELVYFKNNKNQKFEMSHPYKILLGDTAKPERIKFICFDFNEYPNGIVPLKGIRIFKVPLKEVKQVVRENWAEYESVNGQAINEKEVEKLAKLIDKTVVSIKCTLLSHDGGEYGAVVSDEIREPKSLIIKGNFLLADGSQVCLLSSKVSKGDIEVYFLQKDSRTGDFFRVCKGDIVGVSDQTAIVLKRPACTYSGKPIENIAELKVQLYRPSDKVWSDPRGFMEEFTETRSLASTSSGEPRAKKRRIPLKGRAGKDAVPQKRTKQMSSQEVLTISPLVEDTQRAFTNDETDPKTVMSDHVTSDDRDPDAELPELMPMNPPLAHTTPNSPSVLYTTSIGDMELPTSDLVDYQDIIVEGLNNSCPELNVQN